MAGRIAQRRCRALLVAFLGVTPLVVAQDVYEIGPADVLKIVVLGQDQLSGEFTVDRQGMIRLPFLGNVKVAQMSPRDLERKLATLLADGYLKRPQVAVSVKESNSQRVYVTGEVRKPGAYGLRAERSLRALLAEIGELTAEAGHEVVVIRPPRAVEAPVPSPSPSPPEGEGGAPGESAPAHEGGLQPEPEPPPTPDPSLPVAVPGSEIFRLSLREVRSGNPEKDFEVESGDTVYVPRAAQVYVTGFVARPGAVRFEEGMTVYKAISLAGGVTGRGSSKPKVVRIVDGNRKEFKAKPTDLLLPEDTIVVSERFF